MWRAVWVILTACGHVHAANRTALEWESTIGAVQEQKVLSEKISKHLLRMAIGFEAAKNERLMDESVARFETDIGALKNGDPDHNIIRPPPAVLAKLADAETAWNSYRAMLDAKVQNIRAAKSLDATDLVSLVEKASEIVTLLDHALNYLVSTAASDGTYVTPREALIAGRQSVLLQRIAKEMLVLGVGMTPSEHMHRLEHAMTLFQNSHVGIIRGGEWADIPRLTELCTLNQMNIVTFYWSQVYPLLSEAVSKPSEEEIIQTMRDLTPFVSNITDILEVEMNTAVNMFNSQKIECNPLDKISHKEWMLQLVSAGTLWGVSQSAVVNFLEVVGELDVKNSKVNLMVAMSEASIQSSMLVEGNVQRGVPAPPTTSLLDAVLVVNDVWNRIERMMTTSLSTGDFGRSKVVEVSRYSQDIESLMSDACDNVVEAVLMRAPDIPAHRLMSAATAKAMTVQLTKHAMLLYLNHDYEANYPELLAHREEFRTMLWMLLKGDPEVPNFPKANNICIIQQAKVVMMHFEDLEDLAMAMADGDEEAAFATAPKLKALTTSSDVILDWLLADEFECGPFNASQSEWKAAIEWLGDARYLSEKVYGEYLLARLTGRGLALRDSALVQEVLWAVENVTYGYTRTGVPAPITQDLLNRVFAMEAAWEEALSSMDAGNLSAAIPRMDALHGQIDLVMDEFVRMATQEYGSIPGQRMNVAGRLPMLAQRIANEVVLYKMDIRMNTSHVSQAAGEFQRWHTALREGGAGLPAMIRQRPDLMQSWQSVSDEWEAYKTSFSVATSLEVNLTKFFTEAHSFGEQLNGARPLYSIPDPYVPPEEDVFPMALVIVPCVIGYILIVICFIFWKTGGCRKKKEAVKDNNGEWQHSQPSTGEGTAV